MRKEIEEIKVKTEVEHKDIMSGEGIELVPLMKDKHTGEQRNISSVTVDMYNCILTVDMSADSVEDISMYCHCRHIYSH